MKALRGAALSFGLLVPLLLLAPILALPTTLAGPLPPAATVRPASPAPGGNVSVVANFTGAVGRLVDLVALAGGGLLTLVWVRVALSWFSTDVTKKIQAKDRARDALVGTLIFAAALSGLAWGLAHWVLTGA